MACGGPPPHKQLLLATQEGNALKANDILRRKECDFSYTDDSGRSVLHHAVKMEDTSVLQNILEQCTTEDALRSNSRNGRTPLMTAANFGKIEACKLLLNKMGKDQISEAIKQNDTNYCSCIHYASGKGYAETLELLLSRANNVRELVCATDGGANTPLHKAALGGHSKAVRILLETGAASDMKNCDGMTPSQMAESSMQGDWDTVVSILSGANDEGEKSNEEGKKSNHN
jgi:ankyrin repeat protein